jgi:hypothetical protein
VEPTAEAVKPSTENTAVKPIEKLTLFMSSWPRLICLIPRTFVPTRAEMYMGIRGRTQGVKKVKMPAVNIPTIDMSIRLLS